MTEQRTAVARVFAISVSVSEDSNDPKRVEFHEWLNSCPVDNLVTSMAVDQEGNPIYEGAIDGATSEEKAAA